MRSIVINTKTFAVGLQWFLSKEKHSVQELRNIAAKDSPDWDMAARRARQYALSSSGGDYRDWKNVRSLAAALKMVSPSFLGLFYLSDKHGEFWWVLALYQGLVVGMGDQVFTSRHDAETWIQSLKGLLNTEFEESITCETVDDSLRWLSPLVSGDIFSFFTPQKHGVLFPLKAVPGRRRNRLVAVITIILVLSGGFGVKKFLDHQAGKRAMEAARIALLNKEQRRKDILAHPEQHFPQPWLHAQSVEEQIRNGLSVILALPVAARGWVLAGAAYDGKIVTATWGHAPGADYLAPPFHARIESPQKAISRHPVQTTLSSQRILALESRETVTKKLYQCTQLMASKLKLVFSPQEKHIVENIDIVCPWIKGKWELEVPSSIILDASFPHFFLNMSGIIFEEVTLNNNIWIIKGEIYATP